MIDITAKFFYRIQNLRQPSLEYVTSSAQALLRDFVESCKISLGTHQAELQITPSVLPLQILF